MVTLKQLRYFDAVARVGHFGKAAEQCAVTQPALSMQIQELERELGAQLVERDRRGVILTDAGREVAARAARILEDTRDLVGFARRQDSVLSGPLHLGVIPSVAPYLLPSLLPRIRDAYPDLNLFLRETQTVHLLRELLDGQLDLLVLALPVEHPQVETLALFDDRFVLAMPATHEVPDRVRATADLLQRDRLLLLEEGHCLRDQALAFCATARGGVQTMARGASSLTTVMEMVAAGYGVTFVPDIAVEVERRNARVRFIPLAEPVPGRRIGLIFRRTSPRKNDFVALSDVVRQAVT